MSARLALRRVRARKAAKAAKAKRVKQARDEVDYCEQMLMQARIRKGPVTLWRTMVERSRQRLQAAQSS